MKIDWFCDLEVEDNIYEKFEEKLNDIYIMIKFSFEDVQIEEIIKKDIIALSFSNYYIEFIQGFHELYKINIYNDGELILIAKDVFEGLKKIKEILGGI